MFNLAIIELEGDLKGMKHIGDEITETVDYYPGVLVKRRYIVSVRPSTYCVG
jgi:hypothetical protein